MSTYRIQAYKGTGLFLNVYGTGTITGRRNVCIWTETTSNDQKWSIDSLGSNVLVRSMNNQNYALNAKTDTWNCDVMTVNADSYVNFKVVNIAEHLYRIQLASNTGRYLTADGTANNSNVSWSASNPGSDAQVWKITEVATPIYKSTYATRTINGIALHVIETSPANIILKNIKRTAVRNSGEYGINGAFFSMGVSDYLFYNIATNDGVAVGPDGSGEANGSGSSSKVGRAALVYHNNKLKLIDPAVRAETVQAQLGNPIAKWMQGGINMDLGDSNWKSNWYFDYGPTTTSTGRTAMVANTSTNKVYLIIGVSTSAKSIETFRAALQSYFGITDSTNGTSIYKGIMLDGGGSSSMRAMVDGTAKNFGGTRAINEMVCLREP